MYIFAWFLNVIFSIVFQPILPSYMYDVTSFFPVQNSSTFPTLAAQENVGRGVMEGGGGDKKLATVGFSWQNYSFCKM